MQVLVLGSGHVAAPLISYLARKPTELMVASVEPKELNALRRLGGGFGEESCLVEVMGRAGMKDRKCAIMAGCCWCAMVFFLFLRLSNI